MYWSIVMKWGKLSASLFYLLKIRIVFVITSIWNMTFASLILLGNHSKKSEKSEQKNIVCYTYKTAIRKIRCVRKAFHKANSHHHTLKELASAELNPTLNIWIWYQRHNFLFTIYQDHTGKRQHFIYSYFRFSKYFLMRESFC